MILKKLGTEYKLYSHDSCIATTQESPHKRLSKKNCDEIFGVVDVEKLAKEEAIKISESEIRDEKLERIYKRGFNKAMELNKDKVFTEDQMWNMFYFGDSLKRKIKSGNIDNKPMGEIFDDYIKSLQQPTEIEVEIEMDICGDKVYEVPEMLLDENGCLILKKK